MPTQRHTFSTMRSAATSVGSADTASPTQIIDQVITGAHIVDRVVRVATQQSACATNNPRISIALSKECTESE
ncbi:hypothetical protein GOOTI_091_00650 [Gordonia otitidis NBRC 100426]|uniref:Uncharacterized protein n=1 Tax=Gordonia otitidis (strain DSM 44809 / CCUG 52243 / JCM 12355 / NBRC 100426 / IFM 10032) TaxID=1108044 RepID=H5TKR1_GORO1|nr:hypothetical protein GOOTI_091_00650 [Gordonia otitidis NBRC 100426]